jgi:hypothetical protein
MIFEKIKSLRWADYLYYSLLDPRSLARTISQSESPLIKISFIFPVFCALVEIVSSSILSRQTMFFSVKISNGWILLSIMNIIFVFLLAWLIETYLQLSGRSGNLKAELSLINFSLFPMMFLLPIVVVFKTTGFAPGFFRIISFVALSLWSGVNIVRAISELHGFSFAKALSVCLVPFVILVVLALCMFILFAYILVGYFQFI